MDNANNVQGSTGSSPTADPMSQQNTSSLQPQAGNTLQVTANQTVPNLNSLDSGAKPIALAAIPQTTHSTTVFTAKSSSLKISTNDWMYASIVIVVAIFMGVLYKGLMKGVPK